MNSIAKINLAFRSGRLSKPPVWLCLLFLVFIFPFLAFPAHAMEVLIIKSSGSAVYQEIADNIAGKLENSCKNQCINSRVILNSAVAQNLNNSNFSRYNLIITLGSASLKLTEKIKLEPHTNILHALIPTAANEIALPHHHLLLIDQPAAAILESVNKLIPTALTKGMLYSSNSETRMKKIAQAFTNSKQSVHRQEVINNDTGLALSKLMKKSAAIIMLPDNNIYTRNNISQVLLSGFQRGIPFIGYSTALAKTGALASVVTNKQSIINDVAELSLKLLKGEKIPTINFPSTYQLVINRDIAESLNISINPDLISHPNVEVLP